MRNFENDLIQKVTDGFRFKSEIIEFPLFGYGDILLSEIPIENGKVKGIFSRMELKTVRDVLNALPKIAASRGVGVTTVKNIKNTLLNFCYSRMTDNQADKFWAAIMIKPEIEKEGGAA